jgi:hypothetical protein
LTLLAEKHLSHSKPFHYSDLQLRRPWFYVLNF